MSDQTIVIVAVVALYALALGLAAVLFRHRGSADSYLTAGRKAGPLQVSQGLFTLIGGGEFVTMVTLGLVYGLNAVALFVGYAAAFFFLGVNVRLIRKDAEERAFATLADYVHHHFGTGPGLLVTTFSLAAFFALLMLQFSAAGTVLTSLTDISYGVWAASICLVIVVYLWLGGLRAVLVTDVIQGAAMLILLPIVLYAAFETKPDTLGQFSWFGSDAFSLPIAASLLFTGFFVAAASADVWQRAYAAKDNRSASVGLHVGGLCFLGYGLLLALLGIAAQSMSIVDTNNAFIELVMGHLPSWATVITVLLVVAAISSTADTEIFLLSALLFREAPRLGLVSRDNHRWASVSTIRILVALVAFSALAASFIWRDLVGIYTWLISALVVISPMIIFSMFRKAGSTGMFLSLLANAVLFAVLIGLGLLTVENAYLIAIPGLAFYLIALAVRRKVPGGATS